MSLDKAIKHGKEKRKEWHGSQSFDKTCRTHGNCPYCQNARSYQRKKEEAKANDPA